MIRSGRSRDSTPCLRSKSASGTALGVLQDGNDLSLLIFDFRMIAPDAESTFGDGNQRSLGVEGAAGGEDVGGLGEVVRGTGFRHGSRFSSLPKEFEWRRRRAGPFRVLAEVQVIAGFPERSLEIATTRAVRFEALYRPWSDLAWIK